MPLANIINLYTVNDIQSWLKEDTNVYIGRKRKYLAASKWGNPFKLRDCNNRREAVSLYEQYLNGNKKLLKAINELQGKNLGCWCAPLLCHGAILHIRAGNTPVYQTRIMDQVDRSKTDAPSSSHLGQQQKYVIPPSQLDQQVAEVLHAMNDVLEAIDPDTSHKLPIPINIVTPSLSTVETNKVYETLVDSTSSDSSFERDFPKVVASQPFQQFHEEGQITNREKFELECKQKKWRSEKSNSLHMPHPFSSSLPETDRRIHSAPTSPFKRETVSSSTTFDNTLDNPPSSFPYYSTNISSPKIEPQFTDYTRRILEFLANKVDLLSVSINTLQFNLTKINESFHLALDEKIPRTVQDLELSVNDRFAWMEKKVDNHQSIIEKKFNELKTENAQLRERLETYIAQESTREESIRECLNNPETLPNACITDILPLREEFERKLLELDTRLIEVEQYSRRENLIISGIPASVTQSQLQDKVIDILDLIGLKIVPEDISACHRLYNSPNSPYPAKVVVRFCNRKVVNACLEHRDDLQQRAYDQLRLNLRIFDSICTKNQETLRICKWLKRENKIHNHYIRNGFVKVVNEENGRPWKVCHPDILRKRFENIPVDI